MRTNKEESELRITIKKILIEKDGCICGYCGKKTSYKKITLDHIKPISLGGKTTLSNCILSCKECNFFKANLDVNEWLKILDKRINKMENKITNT